MTPPLRWPSALLAALLLTAMSPPAAAQDAPLSARESDPIDMGWMQGSPPPPDKVLSAADRSFFEFPALRYSVVHMRQFLPTVNVGRGLGDPVPFEVELDAGIDSVTFVPWDASEPMTWEESLWANYTDGILVLHRGRIVYERYFGALTPDGKHAAMSVTKSLTGLLAAALAAEGTLDPDKPVTDYVPELAGSAFGDVTVRQVMDMTTNLDYSEDYADPDAEIWEYAEATDPSAAPSDGPVGTLAYLQTIQAAGPPGEAFTYQTPNADALGWIVARASGQPLNELLSDRIWSRIGMEQSGYYQVDAVGTPAAGGGFSGGLRDMGRLGELVRNEGVWRGEQVLPRLAISDIQRGGSVEDFARSDHPALDGWSYRDLWWITNNANGAFAARGVHGQTIYIDPTAEMVIVRFASHPVAANAANDPTSLPAYQAVADYLMAHDSR
ncbi:serine hydrolase [Rubrivirga sp. S365]|uniref:serine hydrolase domain-containing protein n=1 Tax=Rubrivirga sp. S365 TaxID=3076080 RepID=UPI0028CB022A|nr:serine hydrolase [Rubrivirga sp. S365]MDT7857382.1 serine hydrolase [Rubrivirga sp. S365]